MKRHPRCSRCRTEIKLTCSSLRSEVASRHLAHGDAIKARERRRLDNVHLLCLALLDFRTSQASQGALSHIVVVAMQTDSQFQRIRRAGMLADGHGGTQHGSISVNTRVMELRCRLDLRLRRVCKRLDSLPSLGQGDLRVRFEASSRSNRVSAPLLRSFRIHIDNAQLTAAGEAHSNTDKRYNHSSCAQHERPS